MERPEMSLEKKLFKAAAEGDTNALQDLLQTDPSLLHTVSFTCPNKTPLHIAAAKGHLQMVQKLLSAAPEMSLSLDSQGRSPLHLAAMGGHSKVATELLKLAMSTLHSSAKVNALKMLMPSLNYLIDARDEDGNTILHMAVRDKQIEVIEYLVEHTNIDVKAKNKMNQTAWDILQLQDQEIEPLTQEIKQLTKQIKRQLCNSYKSQTNTEKWLTQNRDAVMVVAVLIATMAFQAAVAPPGGVWQEDNSLMGNVTISPAPYASPSYRAGEAVMAYRHYLGGVVDNRHLDDTYKSFISCNTVAFASSISTIMLLISGLPFKRPMFMWFLMAVMWLTITSIAFTYIIAIHVITPETHSTTFALVLQISICVWAGVMMTILLVGNMILLIDRWLKNRGVDTVQCIDKWLKGKGLTWRTGKSNDSVQVKNANGPGNV